jgi:hypothetical protein
MLRADTSANSAALLTNRGTSRTAIIAWRALKFPRDLRDRRLENSAVHYYDDIIKDEVTETCSTHEGVQNFVQLF